MMSATPQTPNAVVPRKSSLERFTTGNDEEIGANPRPSSLSRRSTEPQLLMGNNKLQLDLKTTPPRTSPQTIHSPRLLIRHASSSHDDDSDEDGEISVVERQLDSHGRRLGAMSLICFVCAVLVWGTMFRRDRDEFNDWRLPVAVTLSIIAFVTCIATCMRRNSSYTRITNADKNLGMVVRERGVSIEDLIQPSTPNVEWARKTLVELEKRDLVNGVIVV